MGGYWWGLVTLPAAALAWLILAVAWDLLLRPPNWFKSTCMVDRNRCGYVAIRADHPHRPRWVWVLAIKRHVKRHHHAEESE